MPGLGRYDLAVGQTKRAGILLRKSLGIFQRIGAVRAADVAAERDHRATDRLGTKPMTSQQRERAAAALAALITAWQDHPAPDTEGPGADDATLLPSLARRATLTTPHDNPGARMTFGGDAAPVRRAGRRR